MWELGGSFSTEAAGSGGIGRTERERGDPIMDGQMDENRKMREREREGRPLKS